MATGFHFLLNEVGGVKAREWYEDDTKSVTKNGVVDSIVNSGTGTFESSTIIVTTTGVTDTTSDL